MKTEATGPFGKADLSARRHNLYFNFNSILRKSQL